MYTTDEQKATDKQKADKIQSVTVAYSINQSAVWQWVKWDEPK